MASVPQTAKQIIIAARRWARARIEYRKLLDSKSANEKKVAKAKKKLIEETDKLEVVVIEFEKALRAHKPKKGTRVNVPWKTIFGVMGAIGRAVDPEKTRLEPVIDAEYEVLNPKD